MKRIQLGLLGIALLFLPSASTAEGSPRHKRWTPRNFSGVALSANSIQWSWDAVLSEPVTDYQVLDSDNNVIATIPGPGTTPVTFVETGMIPATSYTRHVVARNGTSVSPPSNNATVSTQAAPDFGKKLYEVKRKIFGVEVTIEIFENGVKWKYKDNQFQVPKVATATFGAMTVTVYNKPAASKAETTEFPAAVRGGDQKFITVPGCTKLEFIQLARTCSQVYFEGDPVPPMKYSAPTLGLDKDKKPVSSPMDDNHFAVDCRVPANAETATMDAAPPNYPAVLKSGDQVIGMIDWAGNNYRKPARFPRRVIHHWEWDFCVLVYCEGKLIAAVMWGFTEDAIQAKDGSLDEYKATPKDTKIEGGDSQAAKDCEKEYKDLKPKLDEALKQVVK